ncbi:MAG TPA: thiamine pyrophosphate-binding protein [Dehalococcoidia bacterium]|nr:thiamine pyrophosphate-binding protein [Dehalococcoidia bacterium]
MTAKEALCRALQSQGVEYVFGNPGTTEIPILDTLARFPEIRYVLALHESVAAAMADGYARASGRPSVANVHTTPGVANSLGMLFNARRDGVPLVLLAGQQAARFLLREPMLAADLVQMTEQFAKWSYQVHRPEEVPLALARALKTSMQPPRGPVFLALPRDVLEETVEVEEWTAGAVNVTCRLRGDQADMEQAADLLLQAAAPVVLAGSGVQASEAGEELAALAEACAMRVYARPGSLPWDHPLLCGNWRPMRHELAAPLRGADLLLVVGAPMFREFPPVSTVPKIPVIHMDADAWEVGKNFPGAFGIVADPKAGMADLRRALEGKAGEAQRAALEKRRRAIETANREARAARGREMEASWASIPISNARLVGEMARVLDRDALIVDEATRSATYLRYFYPFGPSGGYMSCEAGCLGWGLGASLGAKLAQPERQVVAFLGDGSASYSMQALWTAARYRIAVPVIVCNNGTYMAVRSALSLYGGEIAERGDYSATDLAGLDFVALAGSMGVEGRRVEVPDDLRPALEWSLALGRPSLLEVMIDPHDAGHQVPRVP